MSTNFVSKKFIPDSCHLRNDCSMYESLYRWGYEETSSLQISLGSENWVRPATDNWSHCCVLCSVLPTQKGIQYLQAHPRVWPQEWEQCIPGHLKGWWSAFASLLWTSPVCTLNLQGCHGDFEPKNWTLT